MNKKMEAEEPRMRPTVGISYGQYLRLDRLLSSQEQISEPAHHDEMLFIIQHQTSELWFKLVLHEISAALEYLKNDELKPCFKIFSRVKLVQRQLINQWGVLETLTPSEYMEFRGVFGNASGFQSVQYREFEFMLGNKDERFIALHGGEETPEGRRLSKLLNTPSLYDEFLCLLYRRGFAVPEECVNRDWSQRHQSNPKVVAVIKKIYQNPEDYWDAYDLCEKLVDIEENLKLWRYRHLRTVARVIGFKKGTGGSAGVDFLKRLLDVVLFPELIEVRTEL